MFKKKLTVFLVTMSVALAGSIQSCYANEVRDNTESVVALTNNGTTISITGQPKDVTVSEGDMIKMSVSAEGTGLKYQWYYYNPNTTAKWLKSSCTTNEYSVKADSTKNGFKVYCEVTDAAGKSVKSNTATVTMNTLKITGQPKNVTVSEGDMIKMSVSAEGTGLKYQWYYYNPNTTAKWLKSSCTTNEYSVKADSTKNGFKVYCEVTDAAGKSVKSNTATVTMNTLKITGQPKNVTVSEGDMIKMSVSAEGTGLKYQWYYYNPNTTAKWLKSSCTTNEYSVKADSTKNGFKVYCEVTDAAGKSVKSNTATVTMNTLKITGQPKNVTVSEGDMIKMSVSAEGTGLKYQWYYYNPNTTAKWLKSSCTTNEYSVKADSTKNGFKVYCEVTDAAGKSVKSRTAIVIMINNEEWELPIM